MAKALSLNTKKARGRGGKYILRGLNSRPSTSALNNKDRADAESEARPALNTRSRSLGGAVTYASPKRVKLSSSTTAKTSSPSDAPGRTPSPDAKKKEVMHNADVAAEASHPSEPDKIQSEHTPSPLPFDLQLLDHLAFATLCLVFGPADHEDVSQWPSPRRPDYDKDGALLRRIMSAVRPAGMSDAQAKLIVRERIVEFLVVKSLRVNRSLLVPPSFSESQDMYAVGRSFDECQVSWATVAKRANYLTAYCLLCYPELLRSYRMQSRFDIQNCSVKSALPDDLSWGLMTLAESFYSWIVPQHMHGKAMLDLVISLITQHVIILANNEEELREMSMWFTRFDEETLREILAINKEEDNSDDNENEGDGGIYNKGDYPDSWYRGHSAIKYVLKELGQRQADAMLLSINDMLAKYPLQDTIDEVLKTLRWIVMSDLLATPADMPLLLRQQVGLLHRHRWISSVDEASRRPLFGSAQQQQQSPSLPLLLQQQPAYLGSPLQLSSAMTEELSQVQKNAALIAQFTANSKLLDLLNSTGPVSPIRSRNESISISPQRHSDEQRRALRRLVALIDEIGSLSRKVLGPELTMAGPDHAQLTSSGRPHQEVRAKTPTAVAGEDTEEFHLDLGDGDQNRQLDFDDDASYVPSKPLSSVTGLGLDKGHVEDTEPGRVLRGWPMRDSVSPPPPPPPPPPLPSHTDGVFPGNSGEDKGKDVDEASWDAQAYASGQQSESEASEGIGRQQRTREEASAGRRRKALSSQNQRTVTVSRGRRRRPRRMWTLKEEQCLVEALNEVGGPQWSRILELHGPKGIKSNILAERDTIGLKDKARNIKQSLWADGKDLGVFWYVTGHLPANKRPRGAPLTEKEELSRKRKRANSGSS